MRAHERRDYLTEPGTSTFSFECDEIVTWRSTERLTNVLVTHDRALRVCATGCSGRRAEERLLSEGILRRSSFYVACRASRQFRSWSKPKIFFCGRLTAFGSAVENTMRTALKFSQSVPVLRSPRDSGILFFGVAVNLRRLGFPATVRESREFQPEWVEDPSKVTLSHRCARDRLGGIL